MKNITYINAGAGSGKTTRLVEHLTNEIQNGTCRANEVILTTFTTKAADELRERARTVLYSKGLFTDAILLDQAQIGTVHAVAMDILSQYWHLLGLSPDVRPLANESVDFYINQSLSALPDQDDINLFNSFRTFFHVTSGTEFWKEQLREIIGFCITNQISDLNESITYSCNQLSEIYKPVKGRTLPGHNSVKSWIEEIQQAISSDNESEAKNKRLNFTRELLSKKEYSFADLLSLSGFLSGLPKGTSGKIEHREEISTQLHELWRTEKVCTDQQNYITRLFELAREWKRQYQEFKKEKNLIDFNDMEHYLLMLLERDEIAAEIQGKYKILFVDEFQDSSPVQVRIFSRLSTLVNKSYWVGDPKQAIYGFRGSNTDLIHTVMSIIHESAHDGNSIDNLGTSYRSVKQIVEFTNKLFTKAFSGLIPEEEICLKPHKEKNPQGALFHIHCTDKNSDAYRQAVKNKIFDLISGIPKNRIAILCRTNSKCQEMATVLRQAGIPVCVESGDLNAQRETELIKALLTLIVEENNDLAKAKIMYLTNPEYTLSDLIDERLEYLSLNTDEKSNGWITTQTLISELNELKNRIRHLSVREVLETLIITLNLNTLVKRWSNSKSREENLSRLIAISKEYEETALNIGLAATIPGFILYLSSKTTQSMGDTNGVQILTYHKSKGLEWDACILSDLNSTTLDPDNIISRSFYGVRFVQKEKPSSQNLYPGVSVSLLPWIWGDLKKCPVTEITDLDHFKEITQKCIWEEKRLLYVGITRAKEKLFTSSYQGRNPLNWIERMGIPFNDIPETGGEVDLFKTGNIFTTEIISATEDNPVQPETAQTGLKAFSGKRPVTQPRYVSPSSSTDDQYYQVESLQSFQRPVHISGVKEMDQLGTALHHLFCIYEQKTTTREICNNILRIYNQLVHVPDSEEILNSIRTFYAFLESKYGKAVKIWKETPFQYKENGQIIRGSIDLLWETPDGIVLIDYKSYPGNNADLINPESKHYAGKYGAQTKLYRKALNEAGIKTLDTLLYYAINGEVIRIV